MDCTPIIKRKDARNDPNFSVKPLTVLVVPLEVGSYLTSFSMFDRSTDLDDGKCSTYKAAPIDCRYV